MEADVRISGSGNAELHVQNELNVFISGSGNVFFSEFPDVFSKKTGSGRVQGVN